MLVLALALVVGVSVWSIDRNVDRVDVGGLRGEGDEEDDGNDGEGRGDRAEADELDAEPLTVLVLGTDSREELSERERRELGTGYVPGARAEVIALTRLDPVADEVRILSVPRDARVELCDGSEGRINEAFDIGEEAGYGGETCTVQTLTRLLRTPIDHVVTVDFGGFVDIVDALGGVTMYLAEPLEDEDANLDLPAGCVDLDGAQALAFARARHIDDDFGRIARQQRLVGEMLDEVSELGLLQDLPQLMQLADRVARAVDLDSSLDLLRLQELIREHRSTIAGGLEGRSIPGAITMVGAASMVELDDDAAEQLVPWLLTGEVDEGSSESGSSGADGASDVDGSSEADGSRAGAGSSDEAAAPQDQPWWESADPRIVGTDRGVADEDVIGGPTTLDGSRPSGLVDDGAGDPC